VFRTIHDIERITFFFSLVHSAQLAFGLSLLLASIVAILGE
jgi:hypothetical protein